jgi:ketosteroid isomerase-like protein
VSKHNVDLTRRFIEAFNARDTEAYIALCDPSIEWHSIIAAVGGGVYRGHEGIRSWRRDIEDTVGNEIRIEPEAYFDLGEDMLVFGVLHARGRQSGADVAMPAAYVARVRDGLVVYVKAYARRKDALRDLGVSEAELEPIEP